MPMDEIEKATRAAYLLYAVTCTRLGREYPQIQAEIAYHYAKLSGEDEEVCQAIRDALV